jgi:hypothetical protein
MAFIPIAASTANNNWNVRQSISYSGDAAFGVINAYLKSSISNGNDE